jgi:hypothetical protein
MTAVPHIVAAAGGRKAFTIYAEPQNINYFLRTPLTPSSAGSAVDKTYTVKPHSRRQYPGDAATINVPAMSRVVLFDPTRKSGNGLPGRSITLVSDAGLPNQQRRTFTLKGRWVDFHAWLGLNVKMKVYAYNNSGARSTVNAPIT